MAAVAVESVWSLLMQAVRGGLRAEWGWNELITIIKHSLPSSSCFKAAYMVLIIAQHLSSLVWFAHTHGPERNFISKTNSHCLILTIVLIAIVRPRYLSIEWAAADWTMNSDEFRWWWMKSLIMLTMPMREGWAAVAECKGTKIVVETLRVL